MDNRSKIQKEKDFRDVEKSVKRLIWRLAPNENGDFTSFLPNTNDFNSLKSILGSLDRDKKINVSNNVLFAKLYIYHKTMIIRHYGTTALELETQKEISRLLEKPLDLYFEAFHRDLHDNQLNKLMDSKTEKEKIEIIEQYKNLKKTFTLDYVKSKLLEEINEALKTFS